APGALRHQQIVPFGYHEWNMRSDRNPAGDWLLDLANKARRVDNVVFNRMEPLQRVDETGRVERVDGPLSIPSAEQAELMIREVKPIHRHVNRSRSQFIDHAAGQHRFTCPRHAGDAQDPAVTDLGERARSLE